MPNTPHVFISATSSDLGSYRRAVRDVLTSKEVVPVLQGNSKPDYGSVVVSLHADPLNRN